MTAAPCSSFTPRSERDAATCDACGWSKGAHEAADKPRVPYVEVSHETAYGTTCRLSRPIRVF